jgi:hypothetical protein
MASAGVTGSSAFARHVAVTPRGPSDELRMPMCMSCTGANSAFPGVPLESLAHTPFGLATAPCIVAGSVYVFPAASRQFGEMSRWMRSGMAFDR